MAKACTREKVRILSRKVKGKPRKVKAEFMAHRGTNCPKPKRKTGHLREYKQMFKIEAKACAKRQGKKWNRKTYAHCIGQGMKQAFKNR